MHEILLLAASLALIIVGARFLVDGSSAVAARFRVPEFVIGLTVVGIGTSTPELVVSLTSALEGKADMAIGNIVGSNIANVLLILGLTALIRPVAVSRHNTRFDIPYNILITFLLLLFCFGFRFGGHLTGTIDRAEGIVLLVLFVLYIYLSFRYGKRTADNPSAPPAGKQVKTIGKPTRPRYNEWLSKYLWLDIVLVAAGLAALIWGGKIFVGSASDLARRMGISESVIAITLMAVGTSLPELATSIVAALQKRSQLALGNILGSNICNIGLILGVCAVITPLGTGDITPLDIWTILLSAFYLLISVFTFRRSEIDRADGAVYMATYIAFIWYLIAK